MKYWVIVLLACTLCSAAYFSRDLATAQSAENVAVAQTMYYAQQVTGVVTTAEKMYSPEEGTWWDLQIQVETVEPEGERIAPDQLVPVRHQPGERLSGPRPGPRPAETRRSCRPGRSSPPTPADRRRPGAAPPRPIPPPPG